MACAYSVAPRHLSNYLRGAVLTVSLTAFHNHVEIDSGSMEHTPWYLKMVPQWILSTVLKIHNLAPGEWHDYSDVSVPCLSIWEDDGKMHACMVG